MEPGESRTCLTFTIFDDDVVEGLESLTGELEGIINALNVLEASPERITFRPRVTTLNIMDTDGEFLLFHTIFKCLIH